MKRCPEKEITLYTIDLDFKISDIGFFNNRNLNVTGDAGTCLGRHMTSGKICVNNAGDWVGDYMTGGEIHIAGDYETIALYIFLHIFEFGNLLQDRILESSCF